MFFFFFNDTATTEIYTLSLHDALPIYERRAEQLGIRGQHADDCPRPPRDRDRFADRAAVTCETAFPKRLTQNDGVARLAPLDRKSTRLNSSHLVISYAVFCLKKKNK